MRNYIFYALTVICILYSSFVVYNIKHSEKLLATIDNVTAETPEDTKNFIKGYHNEINEHRLEAAGGLCLAVLFAGIGFKLTPKTKICPSC